MLLQGISLPSPLGEGLGVRLFSLERGVKCDATTKLISEKCNATTKHITPLSPWRGAGGEASCGAVLGLFTHHSSYIQTA